jgi:hypothetical protein
MAVAAALQAPTGNPRVIAVIGGGFSGTCLAIHLLRQRAADGRVISRAGIPVDSLYYLGPWLRARDC